VIARHAEATHSPQAKWILENWEQVLPKFVKVFPKEYKRVLAAAHKAEIPRVEMLHQPAAVPLAAV
jgi:glutamate synthase domain-containing protein 3